MTISPTRSVVLLVAIVVASVPALLWPGVIEAASSLHALGSSSPYLRLDHGGLLYIAAPLIIVSAFCLFLAPGLLLVAGWGRVRSCTHWIMFGFGAAFALSVLVPTVVKLTFGMPADRSTLLVAWVVMTLGIATGAIRRTLIGRATPIGTTDTDARRVITMITVAVALVVALVPKLFWEDYNSDGVEAFFFGHSLGTHLFPVWELQAGVFGFFHNFVAFAWPVHWFQTLFGEWEASSRVPFVLYQTLLVGAVWLAIEAGVKRRLRITEETLVLLAVLLYTFIQAYNITYEPFYADLSEPAGTDALWCLSFVLMTVALWARERLWFFLFGVVTVTSSSGGALLLLCLTAASFAAMLPRIPRRWADIDERQRALLAMCVVAGGIGLLHEYVYNPIALGGVRHQLSGPRLLGRLIPPSLFEFGRWNYLIFPGGIMPVIALVFIRPARRETFELGLVTLAFFGVIYIQRWVGNHQFTPAMLFPVIVFWRWMLDRPVKERFWTPALIVGLAVATVLSVPRSFQLHQAVRAMGAEVDIRVTTPGPGYQPLAAAAQPLSRLYPDDYRLLYPRQPWGTDPYALLYYATRPKGAGAPVNYVVLPGLGSDLASDSVLTRDAGLALHVLDVARWERHRTPDVPGRVVAPIYDAPLLQSFEFFRQVSGISLPPPPP